MTPSRRALGAGLVVVALYLAGAMLSGSLSPFARRPLLDGFQGPLPYYWVSPPPSLAPGNQRPDSARFVLKLGSKGSEAGVFSTKDLQASMVMAEGAVPPAAGQTSVRLQIQPLASTAVGAPPKGLFVAGNVYRFDAAYQPGGQAVPPFQKPVNISLAYPFVAGPRSLLFSTDGKRWRTLQASDQPSQQVLQTPITVLGYYAAASPHEVEPSPKRGFPVALLFVIGLAVVMIALIVNGELKMRRSRGAAKKKSGSKSTGGRGRSGPAPRR